ncbi:hypothetical protein IAS59_000919 [Cryptococcus gattii]
MFSMMLEQLPSLQLLTTTGSIFALIWLLHVFVYKPFTSPLKNVPCPPGGTGSQGHIAEIMDLQGTKIYDWIKAYGSTFMVRGPFGVHHRIFSVDPRVLNHVLKHTNIYTKSDLLRDLVRRYMKEGLIVAEGERHKVQRKVSQKLFSMGGLKSMGQVVQDKSNQLRDILLNLCANLTASNPYSPVNPTLSPGSREVDVYSTVSRCTFDLIGSIGVGHQFDSLGNWEGSGGKLFQKYERMQLLCPGAMGFRMLLSLTWPLIDKIWPSENTKRVNDAMGSLQKFAKEKMIERQLELATVDSKKGDIPDRKDLLILMLRHNLAQKINAADKLRDHEIFGQLSTFLFAGSETTAGTISFGLYDLAYHPDIQSRLRAEILECGDNLSFDQIDELPYLDAVVKEIMRINPSLPGTVRQAQKDDIIPLAKPVTLTNGKVVADIHIRKGQLVHVPIEHLHTSEHIWGPTAKKFDPSRFFSSPQSSAFSDKPTLGSHSAATSSARRDAVPSYVPEGPGIWPNFMTFIDGPRRCIGYKLAAMEIKTIIFTLVREFEIELMKGQHILRWNMMSNRPFVANTLSSKGSRLPLQFKLYKGGRRQYEESGVL